MEFNIVFSSDPAGFGESATVLASVIRRTSARVHVRYWCRGFLPKDFEVDRLKVEFLPADDDTVAQKGTYPGHVSSAVFDRLRVIRDCPDWDRCLIMDYDQLAFCDLAPLFEIEFGDALLAAKMQGEGIDMGYAMKTWIHRPLPKDWEHVEKFPYFSMGPLMNLKLMREAGTWETLLAAQEAFGLDEQLSLTAATGGRTMGYDRRWNLFPDLDLRGEEVPDGVVHWTGWPKPWHPDSGVWRADLWESEKTNWEQLRMGMWDKPLAVIVGGKNHHAVLALLGRGWRVRTYGDDIAAGELKEHPDLERGELGELKPSTIEEAEIIRLHSTVPQQHLAWASRSHVVLVGPWESLPEFLQHLETGACLLKSSDWPPGGVVPDLLDYDHLTRALISLTKDEELYLEPVHAAGARNDFSSPRP